MKRLIEFGLVEKQPCQQRPPRYEYHPTDAGRSLVPIIRAMARWANEHVAGVKLPEDIAASP